MDGWMLVVFVSGLTLVCLILACSLAQSNRAMRQFAAKTLEHALAINDAELTYMRLVSDERVASFKEERGHRWRSEVPLPGIQTAPDDEVTANFGGGIG